METTKPPPEDMTREDEAILAQQDMHTLAKWWCTLNSWGWPEGLPHPDVGRQRRSRGRAWQIMCWIDESIGHRVISREWNRDSMTDGQHNDFWRGTREGHGPSLARYHEWRATAVH